MRSGLVKPLTGKMEAGPPEACITNGLRTGPDRAEKTRHDSRTQAFFFFFPSLLVIDVPEASGAR